LNLNVTLLGTGTSHGVPMIGCGCAVCRSTDPRDRRTRPSILIELPDPGESGDPLLARSGSAAAVRYVLVDTSPDLRQQALTYAIARVDAILFTHGHADHVMGLDEIRRYNSLQRGVMPCYGDGQTVAEIRETFGYAFREQGAGGGVPRLSLFRIGGPFSLGGVEIVPVPIMHGPRQILGFRIGPFAYLTDCSGIPDSSWALLEGVGTLVVDALRERPHPTHFTVDEAVAVVERVAPERAYFTHICHDLSHAATSARLPAGVELAYDGLILHIADAQRRRR
jgi:phosphoribosyl 1,2-cyclic phosphate phosphodiesterase